MHPEAVEAMSEALKFTYGNPSSIYQRGRESRGKLDEARQQFAKSIHASPSEIIITSGGTESDNTAIVKTAEYNEDKGKHIITTNVEHHAVLMPMGYLETKGFEVTYLPVDENGLITADQVQDALRDDTILVSIMFGNNEVGSLMPIEKIGKVIKDNSAAVFHTDAVQAYGSQYINVKEMNIDLLSVSSHKINGPKGIGFLFLKDGLHLPSLMLGGEQETKHRAGTENVPAVVGFQKAVELMMENQKERNAKLIELKNQLLIQLDNENIEYSVNGLLEPALPHILSLHFKGVFAEKLLIQLDLKGLEVSAGSACTAGNVDPSHVLEAMFGEDEPEISETIRLSFGIENTKEEVDKASEILIDSIHNLKS